MPKIVVDDFGGKRSDPGMLGSGIYFASSARYGLKDSYTACYSSFIGIALLMIPSNGNVTSRTLFLRSHLQAGIYQ